MGRKRDTAYFGLRNMKYAFPLETAGADAKWKDKWGKPVDMPYAKSMALSALVNKAQLYADDRLVLEVPSDTGYDGTMGMTSPDPDYEIALGFAAQLASGAMAQLDAVDLRRHCLYFEASGKREEGPAYQIKSWLLEVTTAKSGKNYATKGENIEFGTHEVPIRLYGAPLLDANGEPFVDENGMERTVFIVSSRPDDADYETFGDAVPDLTVATDHGQQQEGLPEV